MKFNFHLKAGDTVLWPFLIVDLPAPDKNTARGKVLIKFS
jgi:hypothetical protein